MNARLASLLPSLSLVFAVLLPFAASAAPKAAAAPAPAGPVPVAGTDYQEIPDGKPFAPVKGKIEVVEVFGYTCPHCAHFEPTLSEWKAKLPADVNFVAIAAPFGGYWQPYAQAYYTAQSMGLTAKTHEAMFRALHEERSLPISNATADEIATFYAKFGADPQRFAAAMSSDATLKQLDRAKEFITRSGVDGTPSVVVAGKYRITGNTQADVLRIADHLIARERAAQR